MKLIKSTFLEIVIIKYRFLIKIHFYFKCPLITINKNMKRFQNIVKRSRFALRKYLKVTSIDGFHYFVDQKSKTKQLFWFIICLGCIIFSFYLVYLQLIEYTTNVTSNPIKTTAYPIWKVPFPALTICNYNIVYKDHIQKFENIL